MGRYGSTFHVEILAHDEEKIEIPRGGFRRDEAAPGSVCRLLPLRIGSDCSGELEPFPKRPEESGRGRQCLRHVNCARTSSTQRALSFSHATRLDPASRLRGNRAAHASKHRCGKRTGRSGGVGPAADAVSERPHRLVSIVASRTPRNADLDAFGRRPASTRSQDARRLPPAVDLLPRAGARRALFAFWQRLLRLRDG